MDEVRTGIGYDVHRLVAGRPLILGGVAFPESSVGLLGHSDGDVILHAIADALLGAAALGDIGRHFPDTDPAYAGADSHALLRAVAELLSASDWYPLNVDATLIAEEPRIAPRLQDMRSRIADALGIRPDQVGVKATTTEGLGFVGRAEGLACLAVATIGRP